jgi:PPOX class probable F420-dependent enzyme
MDITSGRYVSATTFRRSGEGVAAPVWIVGLPDGRAGFTTAGSSGKVKRLRNRADVVLRPCDLRGNVADGAPEVAATGAVADQGTPDFEQVIGALRRKYGIQYTAIDVGNRLKRLIGREPDTVAVVLTLEG